MYVGIGLRSGESRVSDIASKWAANKRRQLKSHIRIGLQMRREAIEPIAYLCLGHVSHFPDKPELEASGWLPRLPLEQVVWFDGWQRKTGSESLLAELRTTPAQLPVR